MSEPLPKTDPVAAKLLDEIIVWTELHRADFQPGDYFRAIEYIKLAAREHPEQLVTLSLCKAFDRDDPGWREPGHVPPVYEERLTAFVVSAPPRLGGSSGSQGCQTTEPRAE